MPLALFCAWFAAYQIWKAEREKVIALQISGLKRDESKQKLLDEIAAARIRLGNLRIEIEQDIGQGKFNPSQREKEFDALQDEIASKIEQFASSAEANAYRHRGNIQRPLNSLMGGYSNPVVVDLCVHDLDYLKHFIHDYSRHIGRATQ